jgi:UDP-N-acetylmuramate--alanine ligase
MINIKDYDNLHFVGVKGIGVSALAIIAKFLGHKVTGSDYPQTFITDKLLNKEKIPVKEFSADNIDGIDALIHSVAYKDDHVEIKEAKNNNIPVFTYPEALGAVMKGFKGVATTGCNGKTTTSSMFAFILEDSGVDPTFVIGAPVSNLGVNGKYGDSDYFVVEADEYREAFLNYSPHSQYAVITNVEWDHPDYYPEFTKMIEAYVRFVNLLPEKAKLLVYGQDKGIKKVLGKIERNDISIQTYGFSEECDYVIKNIDYLGGKNRFEIFKDCDSLGVYELIIPGDHNILNATAAIIHCLDIGLTPEEIRKALVKFKGADRRFEKKGEVDGIVVIDDYAHHPTAIKKTLEAAKQFYPGQRIWCIFQPHTFTRTKALLDDFSRSFQDADKVIIPEIFSSAREEDDGSVSSQDLVKKASKVHSDVRFVENPKDALKVLKEEARPNDVIMVLGAGNMYREVAEAFLGKKS